jgi:RecA/RadA recombinase
VNRRLTTAFDLRKKVKSVRWHWRSWLPEGFVTVLVGEPGVGKSMFGLWLVKTLTAGERMPWPDGAPGPAKPGEVIWCDTEASQAILMDRIESFGLDQERIMMPSYGDPFVTIDLTHAQGRAVLKQMVEDNKPRLVVVDSLVGSHDGDESSARDMKKVMQFLAELARDSGIAILVIHHLRKRGVNDGPEINLDRVRGSGTITSYARMVLGIDTVNDAIRVSVVKSNLAKKPKPLGMTITETGLDFSEAPTRKVPPSLDDLAYDFVHRQLITGPKAYHELEKEAKEQPHPISRRKLYDARERLGVYTRGDMWCLPSDVSALVVDNPEPPGQPVNGNGKSAGRSKRKKK